jgi:diaminohydroxyphosphoribosylaminopyrimidine deaminase/5-amino-6-(5-phosphoribosylamino)uracil reductase
MSPDRPLAEADFMRRALELAREHRPSPNPQVGAVIAREGQIVGEGGHARAGEPHAETIAIAMAGSQARGAEMYVSLEPCCHQGRTGPCTEAIVEAGLNRVIVGMIDPDPRVRGRGVAKLRDSGLQVEVGLLEDECHRLLEGYAIHRLRGRPLVVLKAAVTLDGALATASGDSKWISSAPSRERSHALRAEADAVAVGVETVIADDPLLTVRHAAGPNPRRIVLDSRLRTPPGSRLIATADQAPVLLVHAGATTAAVGRLADRPGVETLLVSATPEGRIDLTDLLTKLAEQGVMTLLVEGGGRVLGALAEAGLADRFVLFVAPKVVGGGLPWIPVASRARIDEALTASALTSELIGDDVLIEGRFSPPPWDAGEG